MIRAAGYLTGTVIGGLVVAVLAIVSAVAGAIARLCGTQPPANQPHRRYRPARAAGARPPTWPPGSCPASLTAPGLAMASAHTPGSAPACAAGAKCAHCQRESSLPYLTLWVHPVKITTKPAWRKPAHMALAGYGQRAVPPAHI